MGEAEASLALLYFLAMTIAFISVMGLVGLLAVLFGVLR